jgi:hypothetical protein
MAAKAPGRTGAKPQAAQDWFDREAPTGATIVKLTRRLFERGRASWTVWLALVIVATIAVTVFKVKGAVTYEVTVVVRVSEGQVARGATLGRGNLRAYINEVALTNARLIELMSKHARSFPRVKTDPVFAVQDFREDLKVDISENDFSEERYGNDPPRSARLIITYKTANPTLAWDVAQELADLTAGSTIAVQRATLEGELQVATAAAATAARAVSDLEEQKTVGPNPQLAAARGRLLATQQHVEEASMALRALGQQQELRFEIMDRGQVPRPPNPVQVGIKTFAVTSILALLGGWMLAGAFDPRVLDERDVSEIGMPILGRVPMFTPSEESPATDSRV